MKKRIGSRILLGVLTLSLLMNNSIYATELSEASETVIANESTVIEESEMLTESPTVEETLESTFETETIVIEYQTETIEESQTEAESEAETEVEIDKGEEIDKMFKVKDETTTVYVDHPDTTPIEEPEELKVFKTKGEDVHAIGQIKDDLGKVIYYYLEDIGFVKAEALEAYGEVIEEITINQYMRVKNDFYNAYSEPYGTYQAERIAGLKTFASNGKAVYVTKRVKTNEGEDLYHLEGIGYVHNNAVELFNVVTEEITINQHMRVKNDSYNAYSEPYGTYQSERIAELSTFATKGKAVYVTKRVKTNGGEDLYHLEGIGYVHNNAVELFGVVTEEIAINQYMRVKNDSYNAYSEPYGTYQSERIAELSTFAKNGKAVYVTKKVKTNEGGYLYHLEGIGYVNNNAVELFGVVTEEIAINQHMRVKNDSYNAYSKPYGTYQAERIAELSTFAKNGKAVYVTKKVKTNEGGYLYHLEGIGYVNSNAVELFDVITKEVTINRNMWVEYDGYNIYSQPYGTYQSERVKQLSTVKKRYADVYVTKYVETNKGEKVYHLKDLGWVHMNAVKDYYTIKSEKALNQTMYVTNNNYMVYSQPFGIKGFKESGLLKNYVSKQGSEVKVTKQIETSVGAKFYYIQNVGWVSVDALTDHRVISQKNIKVYKRITVGNSVFRSAPQPFASSLGSTNTYNGYVVEAIKEANTTSGIYYYVRVAGKDLGWIKANEATNVSEFWRYATGGPYPSLNVKNLNIGVSISQQRVYIRSGNTVIHTMLCSTGMANTPTPLGNYKIQAEKGLWFWGKSGGAKYYRSFLYHGVYLFHTISTTSPNGPYSATQGAKLGQRASHGCIRLSVEDAIWFYYNIPEGTPVSVYN